MAAFEGPRARQRLVADYKTCLQHGTGRVLLVVRVGTAARLLQSDRERLARVPRGPQTRILVDHHPNVRDQEAGGRGDGQRPAAQASSTRL